jgi:hypothetical protein
LNQTLESEGLNLKNIIQGIALVAQVTAIWPIAKAALDSRKTLRDGSHQILDGGDASGNSLGPSMADAVEHLLRDKAKVAIPLVGLLASTGLQIWVLFL